MACDPIFNTLTPIPKTNFNQNNELTGVDWGLQQKIYLDAQNAPLAYGKKTYFYGETYSGSLEIKLDYQSSALFPGLIKEVNIQNKTLKRLYISGGGLTHPLLDGIYEHTNDQDSAPYSINWQHTQKDVRLVKVLIENQLNLFNNNPLNDQDNKWKKCILVAFTGINQGAVGNISNPYWQGFTGAGNNEKYFDRYCLPDRLNFIDGVKIYPQYNIANFNINSNKFLEFKTGNANAQIITNDIGFKYRLGVEDISAFEIDIFALGLGSTSADITISHDKSKIGQLHRFLKVGGIYYQDLDSIYGQRYNKLGALSLSNGSPIWNLTGKPSIEMREAFEIMWHGNLQEDKFLPKLDTDQTIIDDNHPKYQKPLFNYGDPFVKFQSDKIFGKGCSAGDSSCSMSLNWASSSSLSRTADLDQNFNNPNLDQTENPSVYEPVIPSPDFKLPDEIDILDNANLPTAQPEPNAEPGCLFPLTCCPPTNVELFNGPGRRTNVEGQNMESSASACPTTCYQTDAELRAAMCACRRRLITRPAIYPSDPSTGPAGATINILYLINKKISSPTTTSNSSKS